jgi:hypothetical protein
MGSAIVLAAMLFVFFVRDVQLLAAPPRGGSWARLSLYGGVNVIYLTTTTAILVSTGSYSPLQLIHTSPLWLLIVVWHCLIWLLCLGLHRSGRSNRFWLAALFPTPVLLVSMASGTFLLSHSTNSIGAVPLAFVVALCWWSAVVIAATKVRAVAPGAFVGRVAIDFAGMANTTALMFVPISLIPPGF